MDGFDAVAKTSLLTAALRAKETARPDRLYADPYAGKIAAELGAGLNLFQPEPRGAHAPRPTLRSVGPQGEVEKGSLFGTVATVTEEKRDAPAPGADRPLPDTDDYNAIRTRFLDEYLLGSVTELAATRPGPVQVVLGAAGMDTRAFRLGWPVPVEIFEVDRSAVLAAKDRVLGAEPLPETVRRRLVDADLLDPGWTAALTGAGYDPGRPSVWLVEGLLYYLAEEQVRGLLDAIRGSTAPGSRIAADLVSATALTSPVMRPLLAVFESWGAPWVFGCDEPEEFFAGYGIDAVAVQPGEPTANFGQRWRDPVVPRDVPGIERVFYVHGRRT